MLNVLLEKLYVLDNGCWRRNLLKYIARIEGGQAYSKTIRKIMREYHRIHIGMYSYGGCFSPDNVPVGTIIGRYCSFASAFTILSGNHPARFKSLHPFFYNPVFGYVDQLLITRKKLVIENDVWVGHAAIILPSVTKIANGAIIGAGCVVTADVPPYAIVVGNPGHVIKYRFDAKTINDLQRSLWWERCIEEVKANEIEFLTFTREIE